MKVLKLLAIVAVLVLLGGMTVLRPGQPQEPPALKSSEVQAGVPDRFAGCTVLDAQTEGPKRTRLVHLPDFAYPHILLEEEFAPASASGEERLIDQKAMVADHILVALKQDASPEKLIEMCQQVDATIRRKLRTGKRQLYVVGLAEPTLTAVRTAVAHFNSAKDVVAYAEPNGLTFSTGIPNDPNFAALYNMHNTGQTGGTVDADIDAPEAWDITTGSRNVLVGIVDSGIDINHPDLAANIWTNPGEIPGNGIDDDHNGYVDDVHGWNFMNDNNDVLDYWLHGTHVAGIVGAQGNNGKYVAGVCHQVSMVSIKAINFYVNGGAGVTSAAVEGIYYATSVGVSVTNNSYGGQAHSTAMRDAIADAGGHGVLFVASSGNESRDTDLGLRYPSCYDLPNIICVGASDHKDARANFTYPWGSPPFPSSNVGAATVDLFAPGNKIYSTFPTYKTADMQSKGLPTHYSWLSGTSMSAPMVAGACALLKAKHPNLTTAQIKDLILASVDVKTGLQGLCVTGGRLNVHRALLQAANVPGVAGPVIARKEGDAFATATSNGDGVVRAEEIAPLTITLRNDGGASCGALQGVLSVVNPSPAITIHSTNATFSPMNIGGEATASFRIAVTDLNVAVPLCLTLADGTGQTWVRYFTWEQSFPEKEMLVWGNDIPPSFAAYGVGTEDKALAAVTALQAKPAGVDLNGYLFSTAVMPDGTVWQWGAADHSAQPRTGAWQIEGLEDVSNVTGRQYHSLALKNNGTVWAWGSNSSGQLGDGTQIAAATPVQVQNMSSVRVVEAGESFSLAVRNDGTVWSWGGDSWGILAHADSNGVYRSVLVPGIIPELAGVVDVRVSLGRWPFVLALTDGGEVWAWGHNNVGQLGKGATSGFVIRPARVPGLTGIVAISAGLEHSFALDSQGVVHAWGNNDWGQMGVGTTGMRASPVVVPMNQEVIRISAGSLHSLLTTRDGHVWGMGTNTFNSNGGNMRNLAQYDNRDQINSPFDLSQYYGIARRVSKIYAYTGRSLAIVESGSHYQPVANNQTLAMDQGTALAIQLTATDGDNDPLTFVVTTLPAHGTLSGTAPHLVYTPNPGFHGEDSFTFQANDGEHNSNLGTITVNLLKTNTAPMIDSSPWADPNPVTLPAGTTLSVIATDDGLPTSPGKLTFTWSKVSGPGAVSFAANNGTETGFDCAAGFSAAGTYIIKVVVSDSLLTATGQVTVTVNSGDSTSTGLKAEFFDYTTSLSAIPSLIGKTPDITRIDATIYYPSTSSTWANLDSRFADYYAARFTGYLKVNTAGDYRIYLNSDDGSKLYLDGALLISNDGLHGMTENSAVKTLAAGYHPLRIEYFENTGHAGLSLSWAGPSITKQIIPATALYRDAPTGANVAPSVSLTSPAHNYTRAAPASFSLVAIANDSDGTISKVEFYRSMTLLGTDTSSPFSRTWSSVAAGTHTLTAKAYDNSGAVTTSNAVTVVVTATNVAPTASISSPANNATYTAPASITISATATDSDGAISKVEFYRGTTLLGTDTSSPYSYTWSSVAAGTYTLTVKAYDNSGGVTTSTAATVTVQY